MGFHDGLDYLLRALHHLVYSLGRTDVACILVGDGDAWPSLQTLAQKLCLLDYVHFTRWVKHSEVTRYLSVADICLAPEPSNPYNDRSTVIKMMEYMALGKPIVAFDLPEHRNSAREAALYARPNEIIDYAQKIMTLMDDKELRAKMAQVGIERVRNELNWAHQTHHLLHAYSKLFALKPQHLPLSSAN